MFRQTGQNPLPEPTLDFLCTQDAVRAPEGHEPSPPPRTHEVPAFLSSAPPRSSGEALLRRIFSRAEVV